MDGTRDSSSPPRRGEIRGCLHSWANECLEQGRDEARFLQSSIVTRVLELLRDTPTGASALAKARAAIEDEIVRQRKRGWLIRVRIGSRLIAPEPVYRLSRRARMGHPPREAPIQQQRQQAGTAPEADTRGKREEAQASRAGMWSKSERKHRALLAALQMATAQERYLSNDEVERVYGGKSRASQAIATFNRGRVAREARVRAVHSRNRNENFEGQGYFLISR